MSTPILRLELLSLGRGDGLLGMRRHGALGPRAAPVSVVRLRSPSDVAVREQLTALGLEPLDPAELQWRGAVASKSRLEELWTLGHEELFPAFWVEQVPRLQASGWQFEALPGFAHLPVAAQGLSMEVKRLTGDRRRGSWLLSLGLVIEGESLDLAPLLADLLNRDRRWLYLDAIASIEDEELVLLHAPGGRRIEARAHLLKPVVGAMVDLLCDPKPGPLPLSDWDAARLAGFDSRAGWQFHGEGDLRQLAERLLRTGSPPAVAPPAGLAITLRPYQLAGLAWLQHLRAQGLAGILADDMGLGKTAQALAHVLMEKEAGRLDTPALAVLPSSLLFNWAAEAARVAPGLRVLSLQGTDRLPRFDQIANADLVLTSYPLLWRDLDHYRRRPWHLLILDEAQVVKNASGRAARAVRRIEARHRLCLTGTPMENHLLELWAQFDFLMPGFLGDARSFHRRWRKPIEEGGETLRAQQLAERIRPFVLRRSKAEVAVELPPLTAVVRRVELVGAQRELYESVRVAADKQMRRTLERAGFQGHLITVLDALLKLRQVCCDPRLVKGLEAPMERAKLDLLLEMLPALVAEGHRVLVFSQFTEMLGLITEALDLPHLVLTGETAVAERGELVRRFQNGEVPVLLASLKAGGLGLTLTAADTVIHFDPWWNPAVEAQASARAHRIGQGKPVFVYSLVVAGSIEERMLELQERKHRLAGTVLGTDSGAALKFSAEELERLLLPLGTD
ncbi:MAG: DEAD/DEAH box helicase [Pelomonas sp.]|nr:DEAD/DEAH box helicase [Roseateles sp.]